MWNCCFRESKYLQAASSSQLNFAYKRFCAPSLKPGGFSAAAAMFWGNQRSKFVEVVGLSRTNRYVNGILINFNNFENSMPKALYIANSLLQLDTPRCFYFEGEGAAGSFISSSQQSSYTYSKKNYLLVPPFVTDVVWLQKTWGPFLESPENFSGPKSHL